MNQVTSLCRLCLYFLLLTGCSGTVSQPSANTPDPDVDRLAAMGKEALQLAHKTAADAVLRQVDTDLRTFTFRLTDAAATQEIDVYVPTPISAPDQWTVQLSSLSPLLGQPQPGLELASLRFGPERVAQAVSAQWPGCVLRTMTLYSEAGVLTWVAFCNTAEGVVTGTMDNQTGVFRASDAPPARMPVTATPLP